jgi:hypothetical protein
MSFFYGLVFPSDLSDLHFVLKNRPLVGFSFISPMPCSIFEYNFKPATDMKAFFLCLFLSTSFAIANAQVSISGTVKSTKGLPIANANILLKNTYDGASSDKDGKFEFTTSEKGSFYIQYSGLNWETDSIKVSLADQPLTLNLIVKPAANNLDVVTISAGSFVAGDSKKGAILSSLDIATTAGTRADIFAALQTLPGAQTSFSESGLFVRGGTAAETKTYFDGMLVKSPFNATVPDQASRGRLSAFAFKGTSFSAGGYSAQYGQALSSALILETTDLPEKTTTGISLLSVGGGLDQNIRFKNSALTFGAYYYNLAPSFHIIKQNTDFTKAPEQLGGSLQYKMKTSATGMFKFYAAYSNTNLALNANDLNNPAVPSFFSNSNDNWYVNTTYKSHLSDNWKLEAGLAYNKDADAGLMAIEDYSRQDHLLQGKVTLTHFFGQLSNFKFGAESFNTGRKETLTGSSRSYDDQISAAFAETDLFLTTNFVLRLGMRTEYSDYLKKYNAAPRTSLGYKTGKNAQVSFAYGKFYQNPEDEYLILKPLDYEEAVHYILKYEVNNSNRNFRIEGYYKDYRKLTKDLNGNLNNSGNGYAKGFELFWRDKKSISNADYWITYSFLDTKRNFRDFPTSATPSFAAKHTASVVYKQFINSINSQIGATYTFASGRPYVNPNQPVFMSDKTKNFNNLSLTVSHLTHVFKQFTVLYLNANNIPGFKNVYGYKYSNDGQRRSAVLPSARRDLIVGLLITIGDNSFVR